MKRIQTFLLAIAMLLAAPAFLTSCQEDAPEINYTMNVSVINDFTKVVEAINNGFLKNEEAIKKLTEAIDKMNADQATKMQAIIDVLNSVNATLETRLAAIEAAMKAQTLTLESKLTLLEMAIKNQTLTQEEMAGKLITAIENLQDSMEAKIEAITEAINNVNTTLESKLALIEAAIKAQTLSLEAKLGLIEAAIKAIPDYSDKFDAVVAALNAMKVQIEALGTGQADIVTAINNTTAAINALIASVNSGNTSAATALAQIIQKLEELKEKIGSGGGGSGGGGGGGSTEEYVDLGLPSGLKWAKCNLGASKPSDYGSYYAWGETRPKAGYYWKPYKWMQARKSDWQCITKYTFDDGRTAGIWYDAGGNFIGDNKATLEAADDAATATLGSPWRMPTEGEIQELIDHCTWTWTTQNGVNGYKVKSQKNGNSIFLPAAGNRHGADLDNAGSRGDYWSSSLDTTHSSYARRLGFDSGEHGRRGSCFRYYGLSVRPVHP